MENRRAPASSSSPAGGELPAWGIAELPAPPPFSVKGLATVVGPGAILLATSIGGGEWLVGPAAGVKYGVSFMGIATIAIALQIVFNLEATRYTLYTGEPIYSGFMRLKPGAGFWAGFYCLLAFAQLGWPALALSSAGTLFSMATGRLPEAGGGDAASMYAIATGIILFTAVLLLFGGTIERMLEYASWFMLAFIFIFLVTVNALFVPLAHWRATLAGFFQVRGLTSNPDWGLLGALAATAGSGGLGNLTITNWMRDKGFGMGAAVGAIASAVGSRHTSVSPIGKIFLVTPESHARWRAWWRYVISDQVFVWGVFCFLGLFLNVNLATYVVPAGTDMQGLASGAYQARYMAERVWQGFWALTLINGFWILYSTHLGNTDIVIRTVTDLVWVGSPPARRWTKGRVAMLYYLLLAAFTAWALYAVRLAGPFELFRVLANVAGFVLAVAGVQILIVNRRFLPVELRASRWREALVLACSLFYGFFTLRTILTWFD